MLWVTGTAARSDLESRVSKIVGKGYLALIDVLLEGQYRAGPLKVAVGSRVDVERMITELFASWAA